jgi:hypothetical protein
MSGATRVANSKKATIWDVRSLRIGEQKPRPAPKPAKVIAAIGGSSRPSLVTRVFNASAIALAPFRIALCLVPSTARASLDMSFSFETLPALWLRRKPAS